jgi:hypothetical protein
VREVDETRFGVAGRIEKPVGMPRRGQGSWIGISFLTWTDGTPVRGTVKVSGGHAAGRRLAGKGRRPCSIETRRSSLRAQVLFERRVAPSAATGCRAARSAIRVSTSFRTSVGGKGLSA